MRMEARGRKMLNLRELENFNSNLFERLIKQMMLDSFFKKE
jgi:hypothetical protein